jgi:hypothetical protein
MASSCPSASAAGISHVAMTVLEATAEKPTAYNGVVTETVDHGISVRHHGIHAGFPNCGLFVCVYPYGEVGGTTERQSGNWFNAFKQNSTGQ